jgi:phage terminase large subunit
MFASEGKEGVILCARQFMNSLDDSSLEEIKAAIRSDPFLENKFDIGEKFIRTKCGRIHYKFTGLDRNVDSVKSKSKILICWIDEAEPVTEYAFSVLLPTIREDGSELWITWNPKSERAAVHKRYRLPKDPLCKIAEVNYTDNPWFPNKLDRVRIKDLEERPDTYANIWEGQFATIAEGAYYARLIADARKAGRIGRVPPDPLQTYRVFVDIGGTGGKADAFSMWVAQFLGKEIRVLDYYEAQGQQLSDHLGWLHSRGYTPEKSKIWLPHDGASHDKVYRVSYESSFKQAGYKTSVVPNQGAGAVAKRIEETRRRLPACWFNEDTTKSGIEALSWYHEKRDKERGIGLGANHDWSSHGADAFGLMCVTYKEPTSTLSNFYSQYDGLLK